MPHFENIDQYEARNPKSGQKEIIPIAPHSMQAIDYRLTKSSSSEAPRKKSKPAFAPVEFDPISVRQMEKEFKQAARADARRKPRPSLKTRLKNLKASIASLFGKEPEKPARRKRPVRRKPGPRPASKTGKPEKEESGKAQPRNRPPKRNRRSRNRPKGGAESPAGQAKGQDGNTDKPTPKKRAKRARRGRRPPNRQNQRPGKNNSNPKSEK